jgi:hypothetical protein
MRIINTVGSKNTDGRQIIYEDTYSVYPVAINPTGSAEDPYEWYKKRIWFGARGTIGKAITWQWHHPSQRYLVYPYRSNPPPVTEAVARTRERFRHAMEMWAELSPSAKWYWNQKAKKQAFHGVNLYVRSKLRDPSFE